MTVQSETSKQIYNGDGATTAFSTTFAFTNNEDVKVILTDSANNEITQIITTNYTLSGAGTGSNGTVTMLTAPTSGEKLTIYRDPALTQLTDYVENDKFPADTHEAALDKLTQICQRNRELLSRSLLIAESSVGVSNEFPLPEASKLLSWDSTASAIVNVTATDGSSDTVTSTGSTTARSLAERFSEIRNVKDWGAKGDGVTDDTAAIQAALDYEGAGGEIFFPKGRYITAGNDIKYNNTTISGVGSGSEIYLKAASNRSILRSTVTTSQRFNLMIHSIRIDGNKTAQTGGTEVHGIELFSTLNARIFNNEIFSCLENGIYCYGQDASISCLDTYIYDNKIFDTDRIGIEFGVFSGTLECHGNLIGPINDGGLSSLYGIRLNNVDTRVFGNHIFASQENGIRINRAGVNAQVYGNHIESSRQHGIFLDGCKESIVANNISIKNGRSGSPANPNTYSGIYIQKDTAVSNPCEDIVVLGNSCHSDDVTESSLLVQKYGIEIASSDAISSGIIAYNNCNGNQTAGINEFFAEGVEIVGNIPSDDFISREVQYFDPVGSSDLTKTLTVDVTAASSALQGPVGIFEIILGYNDAGGGTNGNLGVFHLVITKTTSSTFTSEIVNISGTATLPTYTLATPTNTSTNLSVTIEITAERGIFIRSKQMPLDIAPRSFFAFSQSIA